jgi:hypothetical protein
MSISLEEARKKLDILEKLSTNPELILTELFSEGVSGGNFLYQVNVNGKYIMDYLKEYLSKLSVFSNCMITSNSYELRIAVEPLRFGEHAKYISNDNIIDINADERTYKLINRNIRSYENIMNENYVLKISQLSNYWKRFVNLTFRNRIKNSFISLTDKNKKLTIRLKDFIFWYFIRNKKILSALEREKEKVNNNNKYNAKQHTENLERQNYYFEYAPAHIEFIKNKQQEIVAYLISLGYKEDNEMSEY